jgi:hypothetical protein
MATQGRDINTNIYKQHFMEENILVSQRWCKAANETTEHIIGGCSAILIGIILCRKYYINDLQ